jgi:hypothetical protein
MYVYCQIVICDICVSESELKSKGAIQRPFLRHMFTECRGCSNLRRRGVITQSVRPFVPSSIID